MKWELNLSVIFYDEHRIEMEMHLGKWGYDLWNKAQGLHYGSVNEWHEAKSISTENTFETNTADVIFY